MLLLLQQHLQTAASSSSGRVCVLKFSTIAATVGSAEQLHLDCSSSPLLLLCESLSLFPVKGEYYADRRKDPS